MFSEKITTKWLIFVFIKVWGLLFVEARAAQQIWNWGYNMLAKRVKNFNCHCVPHFLITGLSGVQLWTIRCTCYIGFLHESDSWSEVLYYLGSGSFWHELMIQQRTMRPSMFLVSEQIDLQFAASRHTTATLCRPSSCSPWATTYFSFRWG